MRSLNSYLWFLGALALSTSAAPTDQIPLLQSKKIFRKTSPYLTRDQLVQALSSDEGRVSQTHVGHDHGVEVKYFTFDDTWFEKGVNKTYDSDDEGYLTFTNFNVFWASWAEEAGYINYKDMDCAASKPLALYNTPNEFESRVQSVIRSNATALKEAGLSEFFDVIAWSWKPMGPGSGDDGPILSLDLWNVQEGSEESEGPTYMGGMGMGWFWDDDGYFEPDTILPKWYFGDDWGNNVNWIEIDMATFEEDAKPFNFCFDNLVLLFHDLESEDSGA